MAAARISLPDFGELRKREFARLDSTGCVYLDYTGAALYPASLVTRHARRLERQVFGNPHAESGPSLASTGAIETARRLTLRFLDADPSEYDVAFTANASNAMRIVAEGFPFGRGSRLVLAADNHNSVNGLRAEARRKRAAIEYVPLDRELRLRDPSRLLRAAAGPSLFAFPAQSNFSGVRHSLDWVSVAQRRGYQVLLDAAAYTATQPLSLRKTPADFVAISYYKLFGFPAGVGALVARRESLAKLRRRYFGGGTVQFVSVQNGLARMKDGGEAFEDGTPNFLAMPAVCDGLNWMGEIGVTNIGDHVRALTGELLGRLHDLGDSVETYGPQTAEDRGGVVAFNVRRAGELVPFEIVEAAARERGIAIRGGCFCNPGAAEHAFRIPANRARTCLRGEFTIPGFRACLGDRPVGALRASVGLASSAEDLRRLVEFLGSIAS